MQWRSSSLRSGPIVVADSGPPGSPLRVDDLIGTERVRRPEGSAAELEMPAKTRTVFWFGFVVFAYYYKAFVFGFVVEHQRRHQRNGGDSNPRTREGRPLSRRVQSSTLPPFRSPG